MKLNLNKTVVVDIEGGSGEVDPKRVLAETKEVLGLLTHHPLETKTAKELFQNMAVSVFRFSAVQVR